MKVHNTSRVRVLVVEDEKIIRNSIITSIEVLDSYFEIVGSASNGQEALEKIKDLHPHIVFTDIEMPILSGIELVRIIHEQYPDIISVIISGYSNFSYAQSAIKYGVFNYLLKPIENSNLQEVLDEIKKMFYIKTANYSRHMYHSEQYNKQDEQKCTYHIAIFCVGNTLFNSTDEALELAYAQKLEIINLNDMISRIVPENVQWFMADEITVNQKVFVIKAPETEKIFKFSLYEELQKQIYQVTGCNVTLCFKHNIVLFSEIWDTVNIVRQHLLKKIVFAESRIFYVEEDFLIDDSFLEIVKLKLNTSTKNYLIHNDYSHYFNDLQSVFKTITQKSFTQENIENICAYAISLLTVFDTEKESDFLHNIQNSMYNSIAKAHTKNALYEDLFVQIKNVTKLFQYDKEELFRYIDKNYVTIESVEQVADYFNYNYSYISRLFKKVKGKSMNRYITEKRIELAKQTIASGAHFTLTEVGEICGYRDSKYFSRVFKSETGLTPMEYKKENAKNCSLPFGVQTLSK